MNLLRGLPAVLSLLFLLSGCGAKPDTAFREQLYVFGTLVEVQLVGVPESRARAAVSEVAREFQRMHHDWHAWEEGPLTHINDSIAAGREVRVIPSLVPIIRRSSELEHRSGGLFNPAIGGLLQLWGFQSSERPSGPPPSREAIARWLSKAPAMSDLELREDGTLVSGNPAVQLDFGAFAKGYAVDLAIGILRRHGIENAIVNAGGDLRAIGSHGGRPWRVGIRHPQGNGVLGAVEVQGDEAVFTSGNYERFREHEGVRYPHILDPRTGMPVTSITSVTVIHDDGAEADAAATALVVAGTAQWREVARNMGIRHVMLVEEDGTVHMTPEMAERVRLTSPEPAPILIEELRPEAAVYPQ